MGLQINEGKTDDNFYGVLPPVGWQRSKEGNRTLFRDATGTVRISQVVTRDGAYIAEIRE
jgi:hypothetical protein